MKFVKKASILAVAIVLMLAALTLAACNQSVTLSFVSNGGDPVPSMSVKSGQSVDLPELPYRIEVGKVLVFDGWYATSNFDGEPLRGSVKAPSSDAVYYAKWADGHRLTLDPDGGAVATPFLYLKAGASLLDALKGITADGGSGRTFSGWYLGNARVAEDTLMPANDIVVKAGYRDSDGYHISYDANAPAGTVASGEMDETFVQFGATAALSECGFTLPGYRFIGWTDVAGGSEAKYQPGGQPQFDEYSTRLTMYAVWQRGFEDALGGGDYLFFHSGEDDAIYLVRDGIGEKKGDYDPSTGEFTFSEDGDVILSGKVSGDRYFYYYNDNVIGSYAEVNGPERLEIKTGYAATYTDASGAQHNGHVEYDAENNYYEFNYGDADVVRFIFQNVEGATRFLLQDMDEAGYYATESGYPVIYLDGFGNFRYYYDPEHPTYVDQVTGQGLFETFGVYSKNDKGYYECAMYSGDMSVEYNHREDFLFRFTDGAPKAVSGYTLKDKAIERSSFYGDLDPVEHTLTLDGFRGGVYVDEEGVSHEGTYVVIHQWWMTLNSVDAVHTWFIDFTYEGATQDIYFALVQDNYGTVTASLFGKEDKGIPSGLYIFDNAISLGGEDYDDAFIMMLLDRIDESMVLVKISEDELSTGESVAIYAPKYTGKVEQNGEIFKFSQYNGDAQLNFKLKQNGRCEYVTESGGGTLEKKTVAPGLVVDPNTGTATYEDGQHVYEDLRYTHSTGDILEFYTVELDETHTLYYYRDLHSGSEYCTSISADRIFDYAYETESLANPFPARLLLAGDSDKAYLAVPMAYGAPAFVGEGVYSKLDGSDDEYTYHNNHWVDDLLEYFGGDGFLSSQQEFVGYYGDFTLRAVPGEGDEVGEFYGRIESMHFELDNFKADGYNDKAEYTLDNGTTLSGNFYTMEMIIVFTSGDVEYYLKEDAASHKMKNVSEDAGLYYLYLADSVDFETFGPESGDMYYDYIVYDGEQGVTVVHYDDGFLANPKSGTMRKTDKWSEDFREYTITDETGAVYTILLGTFTSLWDDEFLVYDLYSEAYAGSNGSDWLTEEGGSLHGDGYRLHPATYDEDGDGVADYTGRMVRARFEKNDIQTHAYVEDPAGDVIVFTYQTSEETSRSIVFSIMTGRGGMEYLKERQLLFGSFAYWSAGERLGEYMYLDGNGNAERYSEFGQLLGSGTYRLAPEIDGVSYYYEGQGKDDTQFYFAIFIESESGGSTYFEYRRYNESVQGEYTSDDWSYLTVGFYGEITYTDRYGVVYDGYYSVEGNVLTLYTYDGSGREFSFHFDQSLGYFELID